MIGTNSKESWHFLIEEILTFDQHNKLLRDWTQSSFELVSEIVMEINIATNNNLMSHEMEKASH